MQDLFSICREIIQEYSGYVQSDSDTLVFRGFVKMKKALDILGFSDENVTKSVEKFRNNYKKLDEFWYKKPVNFVLYKDGKIIKGPIILFSGIYKMASKVDRKNGSSLKMKLSECLFIVLDSEPNVNNLENILLQNENFLASLSLVDKDVRINDEKFTELFKWTSKEMKRTELNKIFTNPEFNKLLDALS